MLVEQGFKVAFEFNRVVLSRRDNLIGKGYLVDGLFKTTVMSFDFYKSPCYSYVVAKVECPNIWHGWLGHLNFSLITRMMNMKLISKSALNIKDKNEICVQVKQPRKPFKSIESNFLLLEIIHSDVCDFQ